MFYAITIKTVEKKGVLSKITELISSKDVNIVNTNLYLEKNGYASIQMEFDGIFDLDALINDISKVEEVVSVKQISSMEEIFGKRVIILGGGAQVSQVALGAITEADRHNIRGEFISVDTMPLVGEDQIADAILGLGRLPRVKALVLAGSIMGGRITKATEKIKKEQDIIIISLNMLGSVKQTADLVITDPVQAGVMAVMTISSNAECDINKIKNKYL